MNIILCGKSGSGKDWARNYIIENYGFTPIISHTTRPIRENEKHGKDYYFISKTIFLDMLENDKFVETRCYDTLVDGISDSWFYGTSYQEMQQEKAVGIKDLDGARQLKWFCKNVVIIYIDVCDEIRTERAKGRGSFCETEWSRRLKADAEDFTYVDVMRTADYIIDNNFDEAEFKLELDKVLVQILEEN